MTAPGSSRSACNACACASMLSAARYSSKHSSRETHGPKGISFSRMMSGRARSTRRTKRVHGKLSCARPSGNWQMAMLVGLPDTDPRPGLEVQLLFRSHVEGCVPRVQVAHRGDAKLLRGMVGGRLLAQAVIEIAAAPGTRGADEELAILLAHVGVVPGPLAQRLPVRIERGAQACEVGHVFDPRELAVEMLAGRNRVVRVLPFQSRAGRFVAGKVLGSPPADLGAGQVVVRAERVDEVAEF